MKLIMFRGGATKEAYALADKMSSAWISFIKTGQPTSAT